VKFDILSKEEAMVDYQLGPGGALDIVKK